MFKSILFAAAALLASYLYSRLRYIRFKQYAYIPQLPSNLLLGHLKVFGEFLQRGRPDRHPDAIFEEMWIAKGRPPVMLVDMRPIAPPMLLVPTHEIAEQVSRPTRLHPLSTTKSPTWTHMIPIIGKSSLLGREGLDWKELRRRYNPGFTSQHMLEVLPLILDRIDPFLGYLDQFAASGETFSLETLISNLTFDVIGAAIMDVDFKAQYLDRSQQGEIIRLFWELLQTYNDDKNNLPWWAVPATTYRRRQLGKRIDALVKGEIQKNYKESKEKAAGNQSRSILSLSFQDTNVLTPQLLSETSDQVRTFLFAGHDTNTGVLQWVIYELSRTPRALQAVRDELDTVFGPDPDPRSVSTRLTQDGAEYIPRLTYISAVIKETLRLHPPAGTARMTAPGTGFVVRAPTGEEFCLDGLILYSCHAIIQRDPAIYGETADDWVPERWLDGKSNDIPASAWRPFERGPRNCIGQELANLESRVILAIIARRYDFSKIGLGESVRDEEGRPVVNENGQYEVKPELYNVG
ncbi:cytochrome P450 [Thozetella sp. PMI_491]|nr:cytochrome P450 [Thozetella sp. PMI_491]